jgi:CHAT domain-containing protein/Flp pilus assembly protein TadD
VNLVDIIKQSESQGFQKHRTCVICRLHITPLIGLALLILACPVNLSAGPTHKIRRAAVLLEPGKAVETAVSGGGTYTYRMYVKTGQFLHVVVNQLGAHVRLEIYGPDGLIAATENPNGTMGLQQISTIAKSTGYYALRLIAEDKNAQSGSCRILLEPLHLPNDADYSRTLVERRFTEAGSIEPGRRAVLKYKSTLSFWRSVADSYEEAMTLNSIADIDYNLGATKEALDYYNQALVLWQTVGDQYMESMTLNHIGSVYGVAEEKDKAIKQYALALELARQNGLQMAQLYALDGLGKLDFESGETGKALNEFSEALSLAQQLSDQSDEAASLDNLGKATDFLGDAEKALEDYKQALKIERDLGEGEDEARAETLNKMAGVYSELGDKQRALKDYRQALNLAVRVGSVSKQGSISNNIALVYDDLNKEQEALRRCQHALSLWRRIHQSKEEARTLNNIGFLHHRLGDDRTALRYYQQALPISRAKGDQYNEAMALHNIGVASDDLGQTEVARANEIQARIIFETIGDLFNEGLAMSDLMLLEKKANNLPLAIFFGKGAINAYQQVRRNIQGLDKHLQRYFVLSKKDTYRELADMLISEERLPEAQQVLDMLKLEEYSDFTQRRGDIGSDSKPVPLTDLEEKANEHDELIMKDITAKGREYAQLNVKSSKSPDEDKRLNELADDLTVANKHHQAFLVSLFKSLGNTAANKIAEDTAGIQHKLGDGDVGVYTVVLGHKYDLIVITPTTQVEHEFLLDKSLLSKKVTLFLRALDPYHSEQDIQAKSQALYNILIAPIEKDLEGAHAQTIVWSLDSVLRYMPVAALYDGKQYLVERYRNVVITTVSAGNFDHQPRVGNLLGLAMGVSKNYDGSGRLKAVPEELASVIHSEKTAGSHGPVAGTILLDDSFTRTNMESALEQHPMLVHIASHYVFIPAEDKSYLLLGGKETGGKGFHLTLGDIRVDQRMDFNGIELITLSGCQTAIGTKDADGREIDDLGILAQKKGAKAVVASLWPVVDNPSVGQLMAKFYNSWITAPEMTKSEALQQAQLTLLHGTDSKYKNPVFWAPFILIGNWK